MPCLSNGHIGFSVFGDSIYINGVYNGKGGDSRRARLPNWLNLSAQVEQVDAHPPLLANASLNFELNLYKGYFEWIQTVYVAENVASISLQTITLKQRLYAHRFFNRALIYELFIKPINKTAGKHKRLQYRI